MEEILADGIGQTVTNKIKFIAENWQEVVYFLKHC